MISTLTLLLVAQVCAEWVEISQQHYRKPIRTHSLFVTPDKVIDVEETTKSWPYNNRSVSEYNWNKNPARTPNAGNVKRVQHIGSIVKTTEMVQFEGEEPDTDVDTIDYEPRPNYGLTKTTLKFNEDVKQKGKIVKVSNLGNVKRVQLNNSPVKTPAIDFKGGRGKHDDLYQKEPDQDHDLPTEANEFEDKKTTETYNRRIYINKVKKHGTDRTATFPPDYEDTTFVDDVTTFNKKGTKQDHKNYTAVKNLYSTKPPFLTKTEDFTNYETQRNRFYKITESKSSEMSEINNISTTDGLYTGDEIENKNVKISTEIPTKNNSYKKKDKNVNDFETESHDNKVYSSGNNENQVILVEDLKTNINANNAKPKQSLQSENEYQKLNFKQNKQKQDKTQDVAKTDSDKVNTMENVMKFMKVVADTISKNSRRSFGGKMQYLHELKDSILANIEDRIDSTWPDDDVTARRRSRSAHASPRGHVQIPSSESALMTISFLTFAVFLIKLVLQVIHTYKNKAMMVAPLVVAAGRNVFTRHGQH